MLNKFTLLCACILYALTGMSQTKKTTLSAQIEGYQRDMVYFDCMQTPMIHSEFHTNPGEEHIYTFEADRLIGMVINGSTTVLLMPGDSLHVNLTYEGKTVQVAEFSGTPQAVLQNRIYWDIRNLKRDMRYKSQLLGCAVLDVKPKDRIADSRVLMEKVKKLLADNAGEMAPEVASYIQAEIDSDLYNSLMEYPVMYAELRKLPVEQQEIGDYWNCMEGYALREDAASLSCPEYINLLMRYAAFVQEKNAHEAGGSYERPGQLESIFDEFAAFYTGDIRDAVLYNLLCNFIRSGKEIERADPLLKEYKEKYNRNQEYARILDSLMQ